jgi:hypothetical protein
MDDASIRGSLAQFMFFRWQPEHREEDYALLLAACRSSDVPIVEAPAPEQESSSFGWRKWLILVASLGLLVALLGYFSPYSERFIQRHSDTEMRVAGTGKNHRRHDRTRANAAHRRQEQRQRPIDSAAGVRARVPASRG